MSMSVHSLCGISIGSCIFSASAWPKYVSRNVSEGPENKVMAIYLLATFGITLSAVTGILSPLRVKDIHVR